MRIHKLIRSWWDKLELTTKLSIGCILLYIWLYIFLDILEIICGVNF